MEYAGKFPELRSALGLSAEDPDLGAHPSTETGPKKAAGCLGEGRKVSSHHLEEAPHVNRSDQAASQDWGRRQARRGKPA